MKYVLYMYPVGKGLIPVFLILICLFNLIYIFNLFVLYSSLFVLKRHALQGACEVHPKSNFSWGLHCSPDLGCALWFSQHLQVFFATLAKKHYWTIGPLDYWTIGLSDLSGFNGALLAVQKNIFNERSKKYVSFNLFLSKINEQTNFFDFFLKILTPSILTHF
jgi:hypothetical protein